jgi:hypothetical protein
MAVQASLLKSNYLISDDFAKFSLEKPPSNGAAVANRINVRKRSSSASDNASKDFALKDYIRSEHLTVFVAGEFFGFSAFFLALSSSAYKFVGKVTKINVEDSVFTQIIKTSFSQSFVRPFIDCHAQQLDQSKRCRILVENFAPLLNYFYDHALRTDRLTQKTLDEDRKPVRLPFAFRTPEEIPLGTPDEDVERFFHFRDDCINLRATDSASSLPTCIEYFENFLSRMGQTLPSIQRDFKVVFFKKLEGDEDVELFLTDAYFEESADRHLGLEKPPRYLMFIRAREWKVGKDHWFFPSLKVQARTPEKKINYRLRSVTYVTDPSVMMYETLMLQPSGESFKWSKESTTPSWEGNMYRAFEHVQRLIETKDLEEDDIKTHGMDMAMIENADCCIYELAQEL